MPTYYFLVAMVFMLVNFGYAFDRLGRSKVDVINPVLLIASGLVGFVLLRWIRKRLIEMDRREEQTQ